MQLIAWLEDEEGVYQLTEIYPKRKVKLCLSTLVDTLNDRPDELVKIELRQTSIGDGTGRVSISGDGWTHEGEYTFLDDIAQMACNECEKRGREHPRFGIVLRR